MPAAYGGFETAVEEIGQRLVEMGHAVTVYGRSTDRDTPKEHLGMKLVNLPRDSASEEIWLMVVIWGREGLARAVLRGQAASGAAAQSMHSSDVVGDVTAT